MNHDAPDDSYGAIDVFCSEYGWTPAFVKYELPMDEAAKLFHAILYRKGIKTYRRKIETTAGQPLSDRIKRMEIDTPPELEGIEF